MSQQQSSYSRSNPLIPHFACPRCRSPMKLALVEPAAASASGRDTLVFRCICGFSYKQPMQYQSRNRGKNAGVLASEQTEGQMSEADEFRKRAGRNSEASERS